MKINITGILFYFFLAIGIIISAPVFSQKPHASFSANTQTGCSPLSVQFINTSTNAISYQWEMGNGNTSTLINPSNIYLNAANYNVRLIVTSSSGEKDTMYAAQYINVVSTPSADFTSNIQSTCPSSSSIQFTNHSLNAQNWIWDFGDGNTSTLKNPSYIYSKAGKYTVKLIALNGVGCKGIEAKTDYIEIFEKPKGNFTVDVLSSCDQSHNFQFTNKTWNISSCIWLFGDGQSSTVMNPTHIFSSPGSYSVNLITTNTNLCIDTLKTTNLLSLFDIPKSSILADKTIGCTPMDVNFKIDTTNLNSVLWDFGDTTSSNKFFPLHQYIHPGVYSVSVTIVTKDGCTNKFTKADYIHTGELMSSNFKLTPQSGCAPLKVKFTNLSVNSNNWEWDFGDGVKSTLMHPSHSYVNNGIYSVKLTSKNNSGCVSTFEINGAVTVNPPIANFSVNNIPSCAPSMVNFTNTSVATNFWLWDFGDGNTSILQNPSHIYDYPGNYTVSLISNSTGCSDTLVKKSIIQVINPNSSYIIPADIKACAPYSTSFSDATPGAISWNWQFGDGMISTDKNPSHTYTKSGTYIVTLDITLNGSCTQSYPIFRRLIINGGNKGFSVQTQICAPYISSFIDSSNTSKSWKWIFGDGDTSYQKNPVHKYKNPGFYLVNIEISDAFGCSSNSVVSNAVGMTPCINGVPDSSFQVPDQEVISHGTVFPGGDPDADTTGISSYFGPAVKGCVPLTVNFKNFANKSTSWLWDFGDGTQSSLENPIHQFIKPGTHVIKLIAKYIDGSSDTIFLSNKVIVSGSFPDFSYIETISCKDLFLQFKDSSLYAYTYNWNFGDGSSSALKNPGHHYKGGIYNYMVSLTTGNSDGCSQSISKAIFSGDINPVLWANKYELCMDEKAILNCSIGNYASYNWNFGDGSTSSKQNPEHAYNAEGIYIVKLEVIDNAGCHYNFNLSESITVHFPRADFTEKISNICGSMKVDFTNTSTGIGAPLAANCVWDFGDGSSKENAINPSHSYSKSGTYDIRLSVSYDGNCISTEKKIVKIYPKVYANFSIKQDKTCFPIKIILSDSSKNAVKWSWSFGDGSTSSLQNPTHIFSAMPDSAISLTISDINGCKSKSTKDLLKLFNTDFSISDESSCKSLNIQFTDKSQDANKWLWTFGDGGTSNLQNPVYTYKNNGQYTVKLISSSAQGCKDTSVYYPVIINSPLANFSSPSPANCSPSLVTFDNKTINASNYHWDFGDGVFSNQSSPAHIYNTPGVYTIKLLVSNADGCSDSISRQNYITVLGPIAHFTVPGNKWCLGKELSFTDSSSKAINWSWDFGDGSISSEKNPKHTYSDAGIYSATLIVNDSLGCSSVYSIPEKINIGKIPKASFELLQYNGCSPLVIAPINKSVNAEIYNWKFGDKFISNEINPSHQYLDSGSYNITLYTTTANGCIDSTSRGPIKIEQSPLANFSSYPPSGCAPLNINLNEQATGDINANFTWKVGTYTSEMLNPDMLISEPGSYSISLIVTNKNGCSDTVVKENQLIVYDQLPPEKSEIQLVSVESDTSVKISWSQSNAIDFSKYSIYRKNIIDGKWELITSISDIKTTNYLDINADPLHHSICYKIQTSDACENALSIDNSAEHCTINISAIGVAKNIRVSWTPYIGAKPAFYELYRQKQGEMPVYISKFSKDTIYTDEGISCPDYYSYRIRAISLNDGQMNSFSDTSIARPQQNAFELMGIPVERTTVTDDKYVLTEWYKPYKFKNEITAYKIYRSTDNKSFEYITTIDPAAENYLDMDVNVMEFHYYYKIKAINSCGVISGTGTEGSSILLKATENEEDGAIELNWTSYEKWSTDVDYYLIERKNENGIWEVIKRTDKNTLKMIDK